MPQTVSQTKWSTYGSGATPKLLASGHQPDEPARHVWAAVQGRRRGSDELKSATARMKIVRQRYLQTSLKWIDLLAVSVSRQAQIKPLKRTNNRFYWLSHGGIFWRIIGRLGLPRSARRSDRPAFRRLQCQDKRRADTLQRLGNRLAKPVFAITRHTP